jgi:hypothetical protein
VVYHIDESKTIRIREDIGTKLINFKIFDIQEWGSSFERADLAGKYSIKT